MSVSSNASDASNLTTALQSASISNSPLELPGMKGSSIAFVDTSVENYEQLVAGVMPGTEVHILQSGLNAVTQITETLLQRQGIESLHIISHGQAGSLDFSSSSLNAYNIRDYAQQFQVWENALTENADILLYGCNVASDALGKAFVDLIGQVTAADITASDDLTGNAAKGGDWSLEYQTGEIEAPLALNSNTLQNYNSILDVFTEFFVTNTNDSGAGSLRQAIVDAGLDPGTETIRFSGSAFASPATINLDSGLITDQNDFTLLGTGANNLTVQRNIVQDTPNFSVFTIQGGTVTLDGLTIRNGNSTRGGAIEALYNSDVTISNSTLTANTALNGGAIYNYNQMIIINSTISDNRAISDSFSVAGGGIYNEGFPLNVINTTISGNSAISNAEGDAPGGGIYSNGVLKLINSTISGNSTTHSGGGINSVEFLDILNSTITNNTADSDNDGVGSGGGIENRDIGGRSNITNTIVAGNFDTPNNTGTNATRPDITGIFIDNGNNLIGNVDGSDSFTTSTLIGTSTAPINPKLGILANNGGSTQTHALQVGSLAINVGSNANLPQDLQDLDGDGNLTEALPVEQRGSARIQSGTVDIGAFESNFDTVSITATDDGATEIPGNTGTFRISRNNTNGDLTVYLTRNGTAVPGTDYSLEIGTNRITSTILNVVIPDGQSFVDISLTPIDDSLQENTELVQLFLAAGDDYNISAVGSDASIKIEDNDTSNIVGWEIAGTGDFNGDGKQDILQRNSQSSAVRIWRLDGNNTSQIVNLPTMDSSWEIASIAKFNSDTRTDILWHNSSTGENSIWVMNENTPPQVIQLPAFTNNDVQKIEHVGDFDGDGDADILWRNHTRGWNRIWQIDNGSLVRTVELPTIGNVNQQIKYVADFDGDSDLDILWSDVKSGFTSMWEMNGVNFSRGIAFGNVETDYQIAHVGNFDNDKDLDILWYNSRTGFTSIWEMNGVNLLRGIDLPTVSDTNIKIQKVADFDGDSDLDILWYNSLTGFSCIWQMNGTSLARGIELPRVANTNIKISNVADFDGDGDSDILWYDSTTGSTSLWQISNANLSNGVALPNQSSGFNVHSVGDFDGNGKLDIVWYNSTNSNTKIWLTDGTNQVGNEILLV